MFMNTGKNVPSFEKFFPKRNTCTQKEEKAGINSSKTVQNKSREFRNDNELKELCVDKMYFKKLLLNSGNKNRHFIIRAFKKCGYI